MYPIFDSLIQCYHPVGIFTCTLALSHQSLVHYRTRRFRVGSQLRREVISRIYGPDLLRERKTVIGLQFRETCGQASAYL
jgi:hypothetical protein